MSTGTRRSPSWHGRSGTLGPGPSAPAPEQIPTEPARPIRARGYLLTAALQLLFFVGYSALAALVIVLSIGWVVEAPGVLAAYQRSVLVGSGLLVGSGALPIVGKWVLVGRWKPGSVRAWSLGYVRFWLVKTLVQRNLLALLFAGSPLYVLYLRALGARVGRGVVILSRNVPVCTDLLTIGAGTVIRKDAFFSGYRAHDGHIETGPVSIGRHAFVGEQTVIDIGGSMGDRAQLGHSSSLHSGQAVPDGEHWHGSPAQPTSVDYQTVEPARCGTLRRAAYAGVQLAMVLLVYLPLAMGLIDVLLLHVPHVGELVTTGPAVLTGAAFYRNALVVTAALYFGAIAAGDAVRGHGAPPRRAVPHAGPHLPPVRPALRRAPVDRAHDEPQVLHLPVRRQLR